MVGSAGSSALTVLRYAAGNAALGTVYVYADVSDFTADSMAFCSKLLADSGVAIAPGIDFDPERGGSFVRLSFAGPTSDIDEALRRMGAWLPGQISDRASAGPTTRS